MDQIDAIYYINLDHRTDRKDLFLSWVQESGFPESKVERVPAIHTPGKGHIGCAASHVKALEAFLGSTHNTCIIFEDDFTPLQPTTFWDNFQQFFDAKIPYDAVTCSYNVEQVSEAPVPFMKRLHFTFTSSSYLITKPYAHKMYEFLNELPYLALQEEATTGIKTHKYTFDIYYSNLMVTDTWYCFYPRIGRQRESYSDIENCLRGCDMNSS